MQFNELPSDLRLYEPIRLTYTKDSKHHFPNMQETREIVFYVHTFLEKVIKVCNQTGIIEGTGMEIPLLDERVIQLAELAKVERLEDLLKAGKL